MAHAMWHIRQRMDARTRRIPEITQKERHGVQEAQEAFHHKLEPPFPQMAESHKRPSAHNGEPIVGQRHNVHRP